MANDISRFIPPALLNSTMYAVIIVDLEGRYLFVNDIFKQKFIFNQSADLIGTLFSHTVHPEDVEKCNQAALECITNPGKPVKVSLRKQYIDDKAYYTTLWEFSLLSDENQNPLGIFCLGYDYTPTEKAVQKALEFERITDLIIERVTDGFYIIDRNWNFVKVSPNNEQIFGIKAQDLIGKNLWEMFPDTNEFNYPRAYRAAMENQTTTHFEDYYNGKYIHGRVYGSSEGIMVYSRDITRRKKVEQKLLDSQNKLKAILDSTQNYNVLIGKNYEVLSFNKIAEIETKHLWGKNIQLGDHFLDYIREDFKSLAINSIQKAMAGEMVSREAEVEFPNQEKIWFSVKYNPVYDADNQLIGVSFNSINIDEKKRAEEKLLDSQNKLKAILDSTQDYNVLIGKNYEVLSFNKIAEIETKRLRNKRIQLGDNFLDYIRDDFKSLAINSIQKAMSGEVVSREVEVQFPHQGKIWFSIKYYPVYDADNQLIGVSFNSTNIDEKKRAEEKLQNSENKLKAILDSTQDYNVLIGKNYEILSYNKIAEIDSKRLWGKDIQLGDNFFDYIRTDFKDQALNSIQKAMKGEIVSREAEVEFPNQEKIWFSVKYYPVYNADNQLIGVSFNSTNIDEKKRAEEKLHDSENKLRAMFDSTHELKVFIDKNYKVLYFNRLAENLSASQSNKPLELGADLRDYLLQKPIAELEQDVEKAFQGQHTREERPITLADGSKVWVENNYFPVYNENNEIIGVSIYMLNITARKQAELALLEKNERLREIAHIQSHYVRRPVASILGIVDIIKEYTWHEKAQEWIDNLLLTTEELDEIIHKIVRKADELE
jgi:PAS domain S-box-containing protein